MAPVQLIGAIRPDDGQPLVPHAPGTTGRRVSSCQASAGPRRRGPPGSDRSAIAGGRAGPRRSVPGPSPADRTHRAPRSPLVRARQQAAEVIRLGQSQLVDVADRAGLTGGDDPGQTAQRLDDRSERQALAAAERHAATLEHQDPLSRATPAASATSRVLPMPASPPTSTTTASPARPRTRASPVSRAHARVR